MLLTLAGAQGTGRAGTAHCSPAEEAYRFRHLLIRDAAYDAIPKHEAGRPCTRHSQTWLETVIRRLRPGSSSRRRSSATTWNRPTGCRGGLGSVDERDRAIARRASERLGSAGKRSYERGDTGAVSLLTRAYDLARPDVVDRVRLGLDLGRGLVWAGREVEGLEVLEETERVAAALGDRVQQRHAALALIELRAWRDPAVAEEWRPAAERAIADFEAAGDKAGLARAWSLLAWYHVYRNHFANPTVPPLAG